jgi:hypothetical protein
MMLIELQIDAQDYVLSKIQNDQRVELARLSGGGLSLLAGTGVPTELQFETAIQIAEDWLMPHVSGLQGQVLEIADPTGRMSSGLLAVLDIHATSWPLQDFERLFQNVIDLATGRTPPTTLQTHRLFVADLLLVRELAHHGQVSLVKLSTRDHR